MNLIESLHNHTTLSDGKLSHQELFIAAERAGVSVLAFTDHDALPNQATVIYLESQRSRAIKWIIGIEMTSALPHELASAATSNFHIIGLFVDPENPALREHCRKAQESRMKRMREMVGNLNGLGFMITEADCLKASGGDSVGRPHIVEALNYHTENIPIMEKLRIEMQEAAKNNPDVAKKYEMMMEKGEKQYPYVLFLAPDSFRPIYAEHDYIPDMDEVVRLIRGAGGLAFIAHYCYVRNKLPMELLEKIMQEKRVDGVEVVYGLGNYGTSGEKAVDEERKMLKEMLAKYGLLASGGADAHAPNDLDFYVKNEFFSKDSIGLTKALLESGKANTRFSSV